MLQRIWRQPTSSPPTIRLETTIYGKAKKSYVLSSTQFSTAIIEDGLPLKPVRRQKGTHNNARRRSDNRSSSNMGNNRRQSAFVNWCIRRETTMLQQGGSRSDCGKMKGDHSIAGRQSCRHWRGSTRWRQGGDNSNKKAKVVTIAMKGSDDSNNSNKQKPVMRAMITQKAATISTNKQRRWQEQW